MKTRHQKKKKKEFQKLLHKFMKLVVPLLEVIMHKEGNFVSISQDMLSSSKIRGYGPDEGDASGDETS